ncbi:hypothetical protein BJX62DRAFT_241642 [Aspergillus germanicus]
MDSNASMEVKSQLLELCGITESSQASSSRIWGTHETSNNTREQFASVDSLLKDYVRGFTTTDNIADLPSRMRVDAVLIMSLGLAKEKVVRGLAGQARRDAEEQLETLFWSANQLITMSEESILSPCGIRSAVLDYVLWFGDTRQLQTNLVVLRVEEPLDQVDVVEEQYCFAALAATAMIYHGRAKTPVVEGTYGLVTDGLTWIFLHVNKQGEYSAVKLNWLKGDENAIIGITGTILDQAIGVKMSCEDAGLSWRWAHMARMWDVPRRATLDEMNSVEILDEDSIQQQKPYTVRKKDFLDRFKDGQELRNQVVSGSQQNGIETLAVTSIDLGKVFPLFRLQHQKYKVNSPEYWNVVNPWWEVNPWERRPISTHLESALRRITRVFGDAKWNKAAIRLIIDAIFLDVLTSMKDEAGQYEANKGINLEGGGIAGSTESTVSAKDIRMSDETDISSIFPTSQANGTVDKRISGRIDYNICHRQPLDGAEKTLLVVEAREKVDVIVGRYQAIAYMALIQHARSKAGAAKGPIYGIATDSGDWDFVRIDAEGNVDVEQFNWTKWGGSHIVSLLRKVVLETSLDLSVISKSKLGVTSQGLAPDNLEGTADKTYL